VGYEELDLSVTYHSATSLSCGDFALVHWNDNGENASSDASYDTASVEHANADATCA